MTAQSCTNLLYGSFKSCIQHCNDICQATRDLYTHTYIHGQLVRTHSCCHSAGIRAMQKGTHACIQSSYLSGHALPCSRVSMHEPCWGISRVFVEVAIQPTCWFDSSTFPCDTSVRSSTAHARLSGSSSASIGTRTYLRTNKAGECYGWKRPVLTCILLACCCGRMTYCVCSGSTVHNRLCRCSATVSWSWFVAIASACNRRADGDRMPAAGPGGAAWASTHVHKQLHVTFKQRLSRVYAVRKSCGGRHTQKVYTARPLISPRAVSCAEGAVRESIARTWNASPCSLRAPARKRSAALQVLGRRQVDWLGRHAKQAELGVILQLQGPQRARLCAALCSIRAGPLYPGVWHLDRRKRAAQARQHVSL